MIYTEEMRASQARVEATRNIRLSEELPRFTAEEKGELLRQYHPDYHEEGFTVLTVGPNKGDKVPKELAACCRARAAWTRLTSIWITSSSKRMSWSSAVAAPVRRLPSKRHGTAPRSSWRRNCV
ncbi:hypothetical protein [Megasphaera sp. BL7]|uniref:hypothetical protein n=1 Tax=Megasphaera sp. BL7 TaxID=1285585 RepID=UPI001EF9D9BA|nr:hypothetical protein [Megasphaera sp. BL7]